MQVRNLVRQQGQFIAFSGEVCVWRSSCLKKCLSPAFVCQGNVTGQVKKCNVLLRGEIEHACLLEGFQKIPACIHVVHVLHLLEDVQFLQGAMFLNIDIFHN